MHICIADGVTEVGSDGDVEVGSEEGVREGVKEGAVEVAGGIASLRSDTHHIPHTHIHTYNTTHTRSTHTYI